MKRDVYQELIEWKRASDHKPLILMGARQVGKTYLLEYFAKAEYDDYIIIDFEETPRYKAFFEEDKNPERILKELALYLKKEIIPGKTLLIFDEIQECPNALNSLKYFCEKAREYHIVSAGSLLGARLTQGFPVGKVNFLHLAPLSFFEFLDAAGEPQLRNLLEEITYPKAISNPFHEKLIKLLKYYFVVGGMPEAVNSYVENANLEKVKNIHKEILNAYVLDFSKHAPKEQLPKIMAIWEIIPNQLAKENKKFIFSAINSSARAREYSDSIQWLVDAGLITKTYNISTPKLPLEAYADKRAFKIYALDVGLLGAMSQLDPRIILEGDALFVEFKGAFAENYVAQELNCKNHEGLYYWTSEGVAEVDFVISKRNKIFPLEVKSGISRKKKSLIVYGDKYSDKKNHSGLLSRTTLRNFAKDGKIVNYPLYAVSLFPME